MSNKSTKTYLVFGYYYDISFKMGSLKKTCALQLHFCT